MKIRLDLFNAKVLRGAPHECWLWTAATARGGYGQFRTGSKRDGTRSWAQAHRLSYEMSVGPIPPGMLVCHRCDNPSCVNPAHLFIGTHADNMADKAAKGRAPKGPRADLRGEGNGRARITSSDVIAIRERVARGESQLSVAADVGVSPTSVGDIVHRRSWRHVRGSSASAGAADGAGRVTARVTPVARPQGAVAGGGGATTKGARR